jgi:hypothetical protein
LLENAVHFFEQQQSLLARQALVKLLLELGVSSVQIVHTEHIGSLAKVG